ncbi:MAG: hypothetical protein OK457_02935 [Thaumarchaeota archaeon]|nr:hypothetical protein [Nitrososphaerota archaeon]
MTQWIATEVDHHNNVGSAIQQYKAQGWKLHTYTTAGSEGTWGSVKHYLLFSKD